jgi:delta 1-pyrroline-5-carboxylate dehydrogenase
MTIEREEIFGPVLSIIPFETEAEAVRIANDTPYGLTNYVQSQARRAANRLARQLRAGMVEMNGKPRGAGSFGGVKQSGRAREGGAWGLEEFLEPKAHLGLGLHRLTRLLVALRALVAAAREECTKCSMALQENLTHVSILRLTGADRRPP